METERTQAPKTIAWILWAALLAGQLLFAAVSLWLAPISPVDPNLNQILPLVAIVMTIATAIVAVFLFRRIRVEETGPDAAKRRMSTLLVSWAIPEGALLFALVAYLLTANVVALVAAGIAVAVFILLAPRGAFPAD